MSARWAQAACLLNSACTCQADVCQHQCGSRLQHQQPLNTCQVQACAILATCSAQGRMRAQLEKGPVVGRLKSAPGGPTARLPCCGLQMEGPSRLA